MSEITTSRLHDNIDVPNQQIAEFCRKNHICKLSFFGSVLRDDFGPDSDIDVLVEFEPDSPTTLARLLAVEAELSRILNREVDLGEQQSVEEDPNYIRRAHILDSSQVIYER